MLGHASAAMTLDIYAGLFADDLDAVADRLDRAFVKLNADQMRTKRRTSRSDQTELPFENPPDRELVRPNDLRAASGNRTPDLRITR
jgi:hypothetical protein